MSSDEKHAGSDRYCGECMKYVDGPHNSAYPYCHPRGKTGQPYEPLPGDPACSRFIPSIAAQQLEQMKRLNDFLGNSVGSHGFIAVEMFGPYGG
jgi:hypothetical protein